MTQSPDSQSPDKQSFHAQPAPNTRPSGPRRSVQILCLLLLFYIPVQWIAGRRPGSTPIFSPQHQHIEQQFLGTTAALRRELLEQCARHGIHDIYFTDGDVISPYLLNDIESVPGCSLHRETVVTPMDDAPKLSCSAVLVDEGMPNAWNAFFTWDYLGSLRGKVVSVYGWDSEDKHFDFRLLQARDCAHNSNITEAPEWNPPR